MLNTGIYYKKGTKMFNLCVFINCWLDVNLQQSIFSGQKYK